MWWSERLDREGGLGFVARAGSVPVEPSPVVGALPCSLVAFGLVVAPVWGPPLRGRRLGHDSG